MFGSPRVKNNRKRVVRLAALTAATTVALGSLTISPALADDPIEFPVAYNVTGSTVVKKTNSTMQLGPGSLDGALIVDTGTGSVDLRADLTLPTAQANISLASGFFRIKAKVKITPTAPTTGTIANGDLTAHATANMEISDIWVGAVIPVIPMPTVPGSCKTVSPLEIDLYGHDIDIFGPSVKVAGTYTIPEFKNCWIADIALGALVSGPGNTIALDLASKNS